MTASINGQGNAFPAGQCTYWADERYHELSGYYVPFSGNAADWAGNASAYGWQVSSRPIVPSIICLAPGVQQADAVYGHVGVVESINTNGSVVTSNLNWGIGSQKSSVHSVDFVPGAGISFIYALNAQNKAAGAKASGMTLAFNNASEALGLGGQSSKTIIQLSADQNVHDFLYALDVDLALVNPFPASGEAIPNPFQWIDDLMLGVFEDVGALSVRLLLVLFGTIMILLSISKWVQIPYISNFRMR